MLTLSATCVAIASADKAGTLRFDEREGRFGSFVAVCDDHGIIEVADDMASAIARRDALRARWAA